MAPTTRLTLLVAGALVATLGGGCLQQKKTCDGLGDAVVEVRDAQGALETSLRPSGEPDGALVMCDRSQQRLGRLFGGAEKLELTDNAGHVELLLRRGPDPGETAVTLGATPYRIHDEGGLIGLLDAAGVPIGRIGQELGSPRALVYNPAGQPIAYAERAGHKRVIRGIDDAVKQHVVGIAHDRAAAALALPVIGLRERVTISRYLDLQ